MWVVFSIVLSAISSLRIANIPARTKNFCCQMGRLFPTQQESNSCWIDYRTGNKWQTGAMSHASNP